MYRAHGPFQYGEPEIGDSPTGRDRIVHWLGDNRSTVAACATELSRPADIYHVTTHVVNRMTPGKIGTISLKTRLAKAKLRYNSSK